MMMMMYKDHIFFEASINIVHAIMKKVCLAKVVVVVFDSLDHIKRLCHNREHVLAKGILHDNPAMTSMVQCNTSSIICIFV